MFSPRGCTEATHYPDVVPVVALCTHGTAPTGSLRLRLTVADGGAAWPTGNICDWGQLSGGENWSRTLEPPAINSRSWGRSFSRPRLQAPNFTWGLTDDCYLITLQCNHLEYCPTADRQRVPRSLSRLQRPYLRWSREPMRGVAQPAGPMVAEQKERWDGVAVGGAGAGRRGSGAGKVSFALALVHFRIWNSSFQSTSIDLFLN